MANFEDDDDIDEIEEREEPVEGEGAAAAGANNRNFLLALGAFGLLFLIAIIVMALLFLNRRPTTPGGTAAGVIESTNQAILQANTATAGVATQAAAFLLTPSVTPTATNTPVPPTATNTQVVAVKPSATGTLQAAGLITLTPNIQTRTATIAAQLTQNAQQTLTRTAGARLTGTATKLPSTGFAEDVGLPGLFGLAIGLVVVIVLVRRLRLSTN